MTFPEFDEFFESLIVDCKAMRDTKGKEYAHSLSRFANFDRAAERLGISRLVVANVYLHKHLDSVDSYIKNGLVFSTESFRSRIVDAITYLSLIAGMAADEDSLQITKLQEKDMQDIISSIPRAQGAETICAAPHRFKPSDDYPEIRYVCTRPYGHSGYHVAHNRRGGDSYVAIKGWPQG